MLKLSAFHASVTSKQSQLGKPFSAFTQHSKSSVFFAKLSSLQGPLTTTILYSIVELGDVADGPILIFGFLVWNVENLSAPLSKTHARKKLSVAHC